MRMSLLFATFLSLSGFYQVEAQLPKSLQLEANSGRFVGLPIHWDLLSVVLLESSGQIRVFEQREILKHHVLDLEFQPVSALETRSRLQAEMGSNYDTLVTGPYVIAAPRGEVSRWESRFRRLLAGYQRYFETRGWALRQPDFPLVVIVLPNQAEFIRMAGYETAGTRVGNNLAGMYVPRTNRCLLYHLSSGQATNWQATEATIVHEAVHQLAYNTGVHERLFEHPLWMVEGLATMFEVASVYDTALPQSDTSSRLNRDKAAVVQQLVGNDAIELGNLLGNLVSDDQLFRLHPDEAYALAWAMTFFLAERMPKQYVEYVELQRRRGFQAYSETDRNLDFRRAFTATPQQLAASILALIKG